MSALASLVRAYDRLADRGEVPPFGYSSEKIGFVVSLNADGSAAGIPTDLRAASGKKLVAPPMTVPQPVKRTSGIAPNFLWDKTSYVLGVTADPGKRLREEHAAFVKRHEILSASEDVGLAALWRFLRIWSPDQFGVLGWPEEMKDQNIVFALESERRNNTYIHSRLAARELWAHLLAEGEKSRAACLVTGEIAPIARLHPAIKGVWGAQSSGASIVSFNLDAFTSYGHEQGDNAPVSEAAAFAYTTVLNKFLERDCKNHIQIGDATAVFWADASNAAAVEDAENVFLAALNGIDESLENRKVANILIQIREGRPLADFAPNLAEGVRFCVLGLSPNASRLSVRFWMEDDFGAFTERYRRFAADMEIKPPPRTANPPLWHYVIETAVLRKRENVPHNLAGEWMRAILAGTNYPLTLLSTVLMRMRSDKQINTERAAMLKAVLIRNFGKEVPVALDLENKDKGYLLGRLFALYEWVQTEALGRNVNATIKDKFYGAASAQPRKVFPLLDKGAVAHLSKIGKEKPAYRTYLLKQIAGIMDGMSPADDPFPTSLSGEQQALFALGYYHQRFGKKTEAPVTEEVQ